MKDKSIFIAGGAGFIGSHVTKMLQKIGYHTVVYDNLSHGNQENILTGDFEKGDLAEEERLDALFSHISFDAVMHFAALIDVGQSLLSPQEYYKNNVVNTLTLLRVMLRHNIKTFIFSSTASIFGIPQTEKIHEEHPKAPINPYGHGKLMVEQILADLARAHGLRYSCLRYFNAAGGDPERLIKYRERKESNLIPLALRAVEKNLPLTIFGGDYPTRDGSCIRDYIHIEDLGTAHIAAMERLFSGEASTNFNLGNGQGFTVKEVIAAAERITGAPIAVILGERRPGDPPQLVANATKAQSLLNWKPQFPHLDTIIAHAWLVRQ